MTKLERLMHSMHGKHVHRWTRSTFHKSKWVDGEAHHLTQKQKRSDLMKKLMSFFSE